MSGNRYWATWAVYRRMRSGNHSSYVMVNSSLRRVSRGNGTNSMDFRCRNAGTDIKVEAGDVVGACIYDPPDFNSLVRLQLDIIGQASGYSLEKTDDVSECGSSSMPSVISNRQLSRVNSSLLHLYAIINSMLKSVIQ